MQYWWLLVLAIVLEVAGTTSMKLSQGFTHFWPSLMIFVFYALAMAVLTLVLKYIDIGPAYAIWSGLGTALVVVIGYLWFQEPMSAIKLGSIALIIIGVAGLHFNEKPVSPAERPAASGEQR